MRDLCALTGLERQTIHFYIQEGLVPEGKKTSRNMAVYDDGHLERLRLIKRLQHERFLPLRAIRAVLGGKSGGFSREQRALLSEVKRHLLGGPSGRELLGDGSVPAVPAGDLAAAAKVDIADIEELVGLGLVGVEAGGRVRHSDAWLVELWGELRRAGLTRDRGFSARDLAMVDEAVSALFTRERDLLLERLGHLSPEEIADVVGRVLPLVGELFARLHAQKARDTFAAAGEDTAASHRADGARDKKRSAA
jgi:DNA-binding transcriptional MerR regulator